MGNFGDTYIMKKKKLKRGGMETEKGEEAYGQIWDKNEIKPEVENTFIPYFSIFFNLFSLDQKPISCPLLLKDRDRPTYGTSFKCEDNIFSAIGKNPSNSLLGTIFINNFILGFSPYLTRPYLFANSSFTSLPNLKQSSSDSLLFSVILLKVTS